MSKDKKIKKWWYDGKDLGLLKFFSLKFLSVFYGLIIRLRLSLFKIGIFRSKGVDAKVISVGNITVGGSGKTPMVIHIAKLLNGLDKKVTIVSRGYGRNTKGMNVVSDGETIFLSPYRAGDEPSLMARRLNGVPVIVSESRVEGANYAIKNFKSEIILLDDGFQHLKIKRDLNILLLDSDRAGFDDLLPLGILREPIGELKRANVMLKKSDSKVSNSLNTFHYKADSFLDIEGVKSGLDFIKDKDIFLMSAIANHDSFKSQISSFSTNIKGEKIFTDHHRYSKDDVLKSVKEALSLEVDCIVTTEKDMVKLEKFTCYFEDIKLVALVIDVQIDDEGHLEERIKAL